MSPLWQITIFWNYKKYILITNLLHMHFVHAHKTDSGFVTEALEYVFHNWNDVSYPKL